MLVLCVPGDGTRRNKNYKHRKSFISIDSRCFQWEWTECIIFNVSRDDYGVETGNFSSDLKKYFSFYLKNIFCIHEQFSLKP